MSNPRIPNGLGTRGARLWHDVWERYDLRPDEWQLLTEACRTADIVEELRKRVAKEWDPKEVVELRLQRQLLAKLLGQLGFPDDTGKPASPKTQRARKAARARWERKNEDGGES